MADWQNTISGKETAEGGGAIDGEIVLVPDGEYELRYLYYETVKYFDRPKVRICCSIIEPEEHVGLPVDRFYNVAKLTGPERKFGNYVAKPRGNLVREYRQLIKNPDRLGKISFAVLKGKRLVGQLETVTRDYKKRELSENDRYSRIVKFLGIIPDDDWK